MPTKIATSVEIMIIAAGEKSYEYTICVGQDLCLVYCSSHRSADLAGGYLDGNHC